MTPSPKKEFDRVDLAISHKILADNSWRLDKFATRTSVAEIDGKKIVYKTALTEEAQPFLEQIVENERKNVNYLKGQFEVLCGTLKGNSIEYEYLLFPSLHDTIAEHLRQGNYVAANEMFNRYVDKLHSLEKVAVIPQEFFQAIVVNTSNNDLKMDCLSRGLLDLTPRNILIEGDRWIVLDNEWSFDFPVPIAFIIFRAIKEMAFSLQCKIRKNTCEQNPATGVFVRNLRSYYVPLGWLKRIIDIDISLVQILNWELGFQRYATGSTKGTIGRIKRFRRKKIHFYEWRIHKKERSIKNVDTIY